LLSRFSGQAAVSQPKKITKQAIGKAESRPVLATGIAPASIASERNIYGYEARPLAGIWARAPYLHNGSVPSLAQLFRLKPRQQRFYAGSLAYDPVDVGFVSDGSKGGALLDTTLPGNSNQGHEYGTRLSESEKRDLITYLKSL
jgi:hypothetical protein